MKRQPLLFESPIRVLLLAAAALMLSVCNPVEDKITEHKRAKDIEHSYSEGCDADAAAVCAAYYRCTGIHLDDCLHSVCNQIEAESRLCILAVESCEQIRQCLPQQGDDGIFEEDDDADDDDATDDDSADDDDATEEELLINRNFDQGPTAVWVESSSGDYELIQDQSQVAETDAQTPDYLVYMGGYNNAEDVLYQSVLLPSGAESATLSCYLKFLTYETGGANDLLKVRLKDSAGANLLDLAQYSNLDAFSDWTRQTWEAPVSSWAGSQVRFVLEVVADGALTTSFFVDTCSFKINQ